MQKLLDTRINRDAFNMAQYLLKRYDLMTVVLKIQGEYPWIAPLDIVAAAIAARDSK